MKTLKLSVGLKKIANELKSHPDHWTQGYYARNKKGKITEPELKSAVCWCSIGFLFRMNIDTFDGAKYLRKAAKVRSGNIIDWNDSKKRKVEQVISAFEKAAELAKQDGL